MSSVVNPLGRKIYENADPEECRKFLKFTADLLERVLPGYIFKREDWLITGVQTEKGEPHRV